MRRFLVLLLAIAFTTLQAEARELHWDELAVEAHLDAKFMVAPDVRAAVRHGAEHLEVMAAELERMEHAHLVTEPAYEALQRTTTCRARPIPSQSRDTAHRSAGSVPSMFRWVSA